MTKSYTWFILSIIERCVFLCRKRLDGGFHSTVNWSCEMALLLAPRIQRGTRCSLTVDLSYLSVSIFTSSSNLHLLMTFHRWIHRWLKCKITLRCFKISAPVLFFCRNINRHNRFKFIHNSPPTQKKKQGNFQEITPTSFLKKNKVWRIIWSVANGDTPFHTSGNRFIPTVVCKFYPNYNIVTKHFQLCCQFFVKKQWLG